jgi:hypothetical protein
MADVTITNLSSSAPLLIQDLYVDIPAGGSVTTTRSPADLQGMKSLQAAVADGNATVSVAYTADELASGLVLDNGAPVSATTVQSGELTFRLALAAGGSGVPDDTVIFPVGAMPASYRILDMYIMVSTLKAASTITLEDELAGAGTTYLTYSGAAAGRIEMDGATTALPLVPKDATHGLIVRRNDGDLVCEVVIVARAEI